jgi:FKBP-type peptidyl-prolyl cis-trans isomerase
MRLIHYGFLALLTVGITLAACKREEVKPPTINRSARMVGPTSQQISEQRRQELLTDFFPMPLLGEGVVEKTPDGEVWTKFSNGLMVHDLLRTEDSLSPRLGQTVSVTYKGTFPATDPANVQVFDQRGRDNPLVFQLGSKKMIEGFSLGISTMKIGMKRRIYLPPDLAYGAQGKPDGGISPNQPLIFEVELLSISGDAFDLPMPVAPKLFEPAGPPAPQTLPTTSK